MGAARAVLVAISVVLAGRWEDSGEQRLRVGRWDVGIGMAGRMAEYRC